MTPPALGAAAGYALLSGGTLQSVSSVEAKGSLGAAQGIAATLFATDSSYANGSGNVLQALNAAQATRTYCAGVSNQVSLTSLNNQSLAAGAYSLTGAQSLGGSTPLTLTGDTSSVYAFNIGGNFTLATAAVTVNLSGPVPADARLELVQVATGRVVRTAALAGSEWRTSVAELAAGVYAARLLHQQQLLGVTKVVVLH